MVRDSLGRGVTLFKTQYNTNVQLGWNDLQGHILLGTVTPFKVEEPFPGEFVSFRVKGLGMLNTQHDTCVYVLILLASALSPYRMLKWSDYKTYSLATIILFLLEFKLN